MRLLLFLPIFLLCLLMLGGCDNFGLPPYVVSDTPPPQGTGVGGILDIDPKFARPGDQDVLLEITGLKTTFTVGTSVVFEGSEDISVQTVTVIDKEHLEVLLNLDAYAEPGIYPLVVTAPADGALRYEAGFTVVQ